MTATDELRRMLDEREVDYRVSATGYSIDIGPYTTAYANRSDTTLDVSLRQVTPEQAIEATLGRGTCKVDTEESLFLNIQRWHICGCCGTGFSLWYYTEDGDECEETPHYCPNCGRRVVE